MALNAIPRLASESVSKSFAPSPTAITCSGKIFFDGEWLGTDVNNKAICIVNQYRGGTFLRLFHICCDRSIDNECIIEKERLKNVKMYKGDIDKILKNAIGKINFIFCSKKNLKEYF